MRTTVHTHVTHLLRIRMYDICILTGVSQNTELGIAQDHKMHKIIRPDSISAS